MSVPRAAAAYYGMALKINNPSITPSNITSMVSVCVSVFVCACVSKLHELQQRLFGKVP